MTTLLTWLVIILVIIAVVHLVRIHELVTELRGDQPQWKVTEKDNRLNGTLMLLFALAFFVFCFSLFFKYKDRILPVSASQHGATLDWLFNFNIIIISSVWFITNAILFYFAFRYYRRNNRNLTAFFFPQSHKLELIWTVIPGITLFVIIFLGIKTWSQITAPSEGESIIIELYAKQFDWTARYAGKDNQLGRRNFRLITADNPMGLDYSDPHVKDDIIVRNEFHIPKGKQVSFVFGSRDVIHSAYMPHFRAQMNCVPGMTTFFHFTPTISTEEMRKNPKVIGNVEEINKLLAERGEESSYEFNFLLLCNKICGVSHYNMQMNIIVDETEQQFNQWLSKQKTVGEQLRTDVTQKP